MVFGDTENWPESTETNFIKFKFKTGSDACGDIPIMRQADAKGDLDPIYMLPDADSEAKIDMSHIILTSITPLEIEIGGRAAWTNGFDLIFVPTTYFMILHIY